MSSGPITRLASTTPHPTTSTTREPCYLSTWLNSMPGGKHPAYNTQCRMVKLNLLSIALSEHAVWHVIFHRYKKLCLIKKNCKISCFSYHANGETTWLANHACYISRSVTLLGLQCLRKILGWEVFFYLCKVGYNPCFTNRCFVCFWCDSPQWARASSFLRFHTQRRTTVGRTPLDEWSARRKDPLPDNTQHSQQTPMPPVVFEPTISAGERPQTYALDCAVNGTGSPVGTPRDIYRVWAQIKTNVPYCLWGSSQQFSQYGVSELLRSSIAFQLLLKRVEDVTEETRCADGIYVILQNQRWGEGFEVLLDVHFEQAAFCHKMVGRLYSLFRTASGWRGHLVHFVEVWPEIGVIC